MKYLIIVISILLFQGCLYFNDRGVSGHLYDNCHSYYDGDGNFIERCDENIIVYDEAKDGVVALKDEVKENLNSLKDKVNNSIDSLNTDIEDKTNGVNIKELSPQEQYELMQKTPQTIIKEEIESSQCPCK